MMTFNAQTLPQTTEILVISYTDREICEVFGTIWLYGNFRTQSEVRKELYFFPSQNMNKLIACDKVSTFTVIT